VAEAILVGGVENLAIAVYWLLRCPAPAYGAGEERTRNKWGVARVVVVVVVLITVWDIPIRAKDVLG